MLAQTQSPHEVRIANKESSVQQRVLPTGLDDAPRVRVVPAAGGEEGCRAKYSPEDGQVDAGEAPGFQESVFLGEAEYLLISLWGAASALDFVIEFCADDDNSARRGRLTGSIKLT